MLFIVKKIACDLALLCLKVLLGTHGRNYHKTGPMENNHNNRLKESINKEWRMQIAVYYTIHRIMSLFWGQILWIDLWWWLFHVVAHVICICRCNCQIPTITIFVKATEFANLPPMSNLKILNPISKDFLWEWMSVTKQNDKYLLFKVLSIVSYSISWFFW